MNILLIIFLVATVLAIFFAGVTYWYSKDGNTDNVSFGAFAFVAFAIAFALTPESHKSPRESRYSGFVEHHIDAFGEGLEVYIKQNNGSFPPEEGWRDSLIKALEQADEEKRSDPTQNPNLFTANRNIALLKNPGRNFAYNGYLAGKNISEVKPDGLIAFGESNVGGRDPVFRSASELVADQMGVNGVALKAGTTKIRGRWIREGRIDANSYFDRTNVTSLNIPYSQHPLIILIGQGILYSGLILSVIFLGLGTSGVVLGKDNAPLGGLYLSGFLCLLIIFLSLPYYRESSGFRRGSTSSSGLR